MSAFRRLLLCWFNGTYTALPWRTVSILALTAMYAITPFDLIPDTIPIFGVIDDALLVYVLWRSLRKDVRQFLEWEKGRNA
jgi:uncharacterized membrane protein YkvA (DUF1232 family)